MKLDRKTNLLLTEKSGSGSVLTAAAGGVRGGLETFVLQDKKLKKIRKIGRKPTPLRHIAAERFLDEASAHVDALLRYFGSLNPEKWSFTGKIIKKMARVRKKKIYVFSVKTVLRLQKWT